MDARASQSGGSRRRLSRSQCSDNVVHKLSETGELRDTEVNSSDCHSHTIKFVGNRNVGVVPRVDEETGTPKGVAVRDELVDVVVPVGHNAPMHLERRRPFGVCNENWVKAWPDDNVRLDGDRECWSASDEAERRVEGFVTNALRV
jgi:hypothetical protein